LNRVDHAGELGEETVTSRLDNPAGVRRDNGVDQLASVFGQRSQGAGLVRCHEPAVAGDIGYKDGT
jgi:hypothetical protein